MQDRSHRAYTLHTGLNTPQELIVLSLRHSLYLPLDELVYISREYVNAAISGAGIASLLKR